MTPFRILALDGGGSWAMLQAMALRELYGDCRGHELLSRFHLVAGNSGGSILLAGLATNVRLSRLIAFYRDADQVNRVFVRTRSAYTPWWHRIGKAVVPALRHIGPKYGTPAKRAGLAAVLTDLCAEGGTSDLANVILRQPLSALPAAIGAGAPHFLVAAQDYDRERLRLFRSETHSPSGGAVRTDGAAAASLLDAVHASSTAPVNYFDYPAQVGGRRYWDGGLSGHNNPVLVALTETLAHATVQPAQVRILNIGTGGTAQPERTATTTGADYLFQHPQTPGLMRDIRKLATAILAEPPVTAAYVAHTVLARLHGLPPDTPGQLVRLNPLVAPLRTDTGDTVHFTVPPFTPGDDAGNEALFRQLLALELDATTPEALAAIYRLGEAWLRGDVANQPLRASAQLACEIGHDRYPAARAAWLALA